MLVLLPLLLPRLLPLLLVRRPLLRALLLPLLPLLPPRIARLLQLALLLFNFGEKGAGLLLEVSFAFLGDLVYLLGWPGFCFLEPGLLCGGLAYCVRRPCLPMRMPMPMRAHDAPRLEDSAESVEDSVGVSIVLPHFARARGCARLRFKKKCRGRAPEAALRGRPKRNNEVARQRLPLRKKS